MIKTPSATSHPIEGRDDLFAQCPDCESRDFLIDDHEPGVFICLGCNSHWRYSLGYVWRVVGHPTPSSQVEHSAPPGLS